MALTLVQKLLPQVLGMQQQNPGLDVRWFVGKLLGVGEDTLKELPGEPGGGDIAAAVNFWVSKGYGVEKTPSPFAGQQQPPKSMIEEAEDVVAALGSGAINEKEARDKLASIGMSAASAEPYIVLGLKMKAAGGKTVTAVPAVFPTEVKPPTSVIPGGAPDPKLTGLDPKKEMAALFRQRLQKQPMAAFRQFAEALGAPGGGAFSERALRFLGAPAEQGYYLGPFLQPKQFEGKNPLEKFKNFGMAQFLGGMAPPLPGGALGPQSGFGIPSTQQIRTALSQAGGLFGKTTGTPQQAIADVLNAPDANRSVFEMIANPIGAQAGDLFGPAIAAFLSRAFARFQQEQEAKDNPLSFLQEVIAGKAGPEFAGMTFK